MWLRNLSQLSAESDCSQSAGRQNRRKKEREDPASENQGSEMGQLAVKVKPLNVVKEGMLAMHVRLLPSLFLCWLLLAH